ncbi:MAG: aminotransferase class IV [Alphaproteobacteria bacterium]|nr:aminotransferase class IV [Alphaproteobacteria bacterium]
MHAHLITCLNGAFMPAEKAMIPVADRGFRLGDGVFENIRLTAGIPYQWALHLNRLHEGISALRMTPPAVDWQSIARQLIAMNNAREGFLRLAISRGVGSYGYLPVTGIAANWVMEYLPPIPTPAAPFSLWMGARERPSLAALPMNYKIAHGIGSTLALLEAHEQGCDDALMLTSTGHLCEAASASLFWCSRGRLFTPALATGCLAGTTRAAVLRLSPLPVEEVCVKPEALEEADMLFVSNTRLDVWPVSQLLPVGRRYPTSHAVFRDIHARLAADRAAYVATHQGEWAAG